MIMLQEKNATALNFREEICFNLVSHLKEHPNISLIEMFSQYAYAMQMKFHSYLITVTPSEDSIFVQEEAFYSKWTEELNHILMDNDLPFIEAFAKAKYFLDQMFLTVTEKGTLEYTYHKRALITSSQLQTMLKISRATVSRYVALGMESIPGIGHRCYPIHNNFYWGNGIWAAKVQALYQSYRLRNRTKEDIIRELEDEISKFQDIYKGTFEDIFGDVKDPYELDEPDDYFDWRDALEELNEKQHE